MEKLQHELNPFGLQTQSFVDHDGNLIVDYKQDIQTQVEMVRRARDTGEGWKKGVKQGFVHALHIPDSVILELRKIGVDVYSNPSYKDLVAGLKKIDRFEACDLTGKKLV